MVMRRILIISALCLLGVNLYAQEYKVGTYNIFTSDSRLKVIGKDENGEVVVLDLTEQDMQQILASVTP